MTTKAAYAGEAFRTGRRRRAMSSSIKHAVDAMMAFGGLVFANASLGLELGLPEGAAGASLGGTLLLTGIALLSRSRRAWQPRGRRTALAAIAPMPRSTIAVGVVAERAA